MFDQLLTLAVQHYVVFGGIGLVVGVLFNLAFVTGPDIVPSLSPDERY